jgi:outer membrane receptor protein involved in Fe transport
MDSILQNTFTRFILTSSLLLCTLQSIAQLSYQGTVKGTDGAGIPGVSVQIKNSPRGEHTDVEGKFRLNGLKSGVYEIVFSAVGYYSQALQVKLQNGKTLEQTVLLQESSQDLNEVRVIGKSESRTLKEGAYNVNAIDTRAFANTSSDINQVLNRMSGVRIQESGGLGSDFRFSLNGLSGNHIKFFIDGIPMESFGGGLSLNNIPVNLAERIEVYKGVVPAYLGSDALGGAVNIVTKGKGGNKLDASYSVGSFNTHRAAIAGSYTAPKSGITMNVSSYYNYSDNNYYMRNNPKANVKLQVIEDGKFVVKDKLRRFHDGFESYMGQIELGVSNKKWADVFVLGLTHTNTFNERQTGATQDKVIGEMTNKSHNTVPSLRYRKDDLFLKELALRAFANLSNDRTVVTDTSSRTWYQWNGIPDRINQTGGELSERKSITHLTGGNALAQLNLNYALTPHHMFNVNYNHNSSFRETYNEIDPYNHSYDRSNRLNKKILGLTYQQDFFNSRLSNSFFVKHFGFSGKVLSADSTTSKQQSSYWGYGGASRFKLTEGTGIKASYEHAFRLPGLIELYGNAEEVLGNRDLKPENSDNYNLGFFFTKRINNHTFFAEASGFYRNTKNYIYSMPALTSSTGGDFSMYYNAGGIKINGFEADLRYEYFRLLSFSVNLSYQNAVDRERYVQGTVREKITYLSRIPNQPWLYGSTDFNIGRSNLLGKGTRIQFNWFTQFINAYSLSWSKLGNKSTKDYIPTQLIQNIGITYSLKSGKYNITIESRNLTDQIAYDNFKLQKPGRSFFLKLRYVLSSYNMFNY